MAELETIPRTYQSETLIIPIIDVSGSMSGVKMASLNEAMEEMVGVLRNINEESSDTQLLIAPMEFSTGARWFALKNNHPANIDEFRWLDMKAHGMTDLGAAFKLLTEKLTTDDKGGWMAGRGGVAPIIILISDGTPTDDYRSELNLLKNRGWFKAALKYAIAIDGADRNVLEEFTGNSEAIFDLREFINNVDLLVKHIIVSCSQTCSKFEWEFDSHTTNQTTKRLTGFKCDDMDLSIITQISNEINETSIFEGDYYLARDNAGKLFIIFPESDKIRFYNYSQDKLDEWAEQFNSSGIEIEEVFFREHKKYIYIVYKEFGVLKCKIVAQKELTETISNDSKRSIVLEEW